MVRAVVSGVNAATLKGFDAYGIRAATFSPDGKSLTVVGYHNGIKQWDVAAAKNTVIRQADEYIPCAAFMPEGKTLAMGGLRQEDQAMGRGAGRGNGQVDGRSMLSLLIQLISLRSPGFGSVGVRE